MSRHPSSFRDPSGYIFTRDGVLYRLINKSYEDHYRQLKNSGLLQELVNRKLLIGHEELDWMNDGQTDALLTVRPEQLANISYASEWSFHALKDAALLHLEMMLIAIKHGMILKDATPYNVQFRNGKPIFIDTLSFTAYNENLPWIAYRQFCESFLYPLLLEHNRVLYTYQVATTFPEGIAARVAANLLPFKCRFSLGCWLHVYLPASVGVSATGITKANGGKTVIETGTTEAGGDKTVIETGTPKAAGGTVVTGTAPTKAGTRFSKEKMINMLNHLQNMISSLKSNDKSPTAWHNYYAETILSQDYLSQKRHVFQSFIDSLNITAALDLGANDGYFSRLMAARNIAVTAIDTDAPSVNRLYLESKAQALNIAALIVDIANPTPAIGFNNTEHDSFIKRMNADLVVALAVIHHLVISKNIPLQLIARFLSDNCEHLIIEFVPKDDPKVQQMLSTREDIFVGYNVDEFERTFAHFFILVQKTPVGTTSRIMYLYRKK